MPILEKTAALSFWLRRRKMHNLRLSVTISPSAIALKAKGKGEGGGGFLRGGGRRFSMSRGYADSMEHIKNEFAAPLKWCYASRNSKRVCWVDTACTRGDVEDVASEQGGK